LIQIVIPSKSESFLV